ncbi:MAG: iron ABC transporter substrate-binding protein, partial [Verrucomicrobiota bacterium]
MPRIITILLLLAITLAAPFLLRPKEDAEQASYKNAERLVIITPHNESIRAEFQRAFVRYMKDEHNREVFIDWRQPGGTSEITKFIKSESTNAFGNLWKKETGKSFNLKIRDAFTNSRLDETASDDEKAARALYLSSEAGIGIDLFFGGGAYDFSKQASAGTLVPQDPSGRFGPTALAKERPEWFSDAVMPAKVSGEPFRDEEMRWVGTVLSAFGMCYNDDSLE